MITKILKQFRDQIEKSDISICIANNIWRPGFQDFKLATDWNIYNLIIFNVIQNAIKYNNKNGTIFFGLDLHEGEHNLVEL